MMKRLIKPASFLMYVLVIISFFMGGMYLAEVAGAADGQGLAGGAIVFFYGVVSAGIAFLFSMFLAYHLDHSSIVRINKILGIIVGIIALWITFRIATMNSDERIMDDAPAKPTTSMKH